MRHNEIHRSKGNFARCRRTLEVADIIYRGSLGIANCGRYFKRDVKHAVDHEREREREREREMCAFVVCREAELGTARFVLFLPMPLYRLIIYKRAT